VLAIQSISDERGCPLKVNLRATDLATTSAFVNVAGSVADTDLQFVVIQSPAKPWNTLLGGLLEFGKDWMVLVEGGLGTRMSILGAAVYRF
jgi:hypothetical protein